MDISLVTLSTNANFGGDPAAVQAMIRAGIQAELVEEGRIIQNMYRATVRTWDRSVDFSVLLEMGGDEWSVTVYTDDRIYQYIDEGTSVRYATMTRNFVPKTRNRVIGSQQGRGGVAYVSTRRPRPGIEAREFSDEIFARRSPIFEARVEKIINNALDKFWGSI